MSSPSAFVPTAEAAFIAGISDRDMNRVVDERILPESLVEQHNGRFFARLGAALARFYFGTEKELVADYRRQIMTDMTTRLIHRPDKDLLLGLTGELPADVSWRVIRAHMQIDLEGHIHETIKRMRQVERAKNAVRCDPEILGGEPVFAGTRVPIDIVLASLKKGIELKRLKASYPHISEEAIESAQLFGLIHPRRGRPPRRLAEQHPDWKVKSRKVVRPASKA
jgi:uncharacterized protein (DUF433 family)